MSFLKRFFGSAISQAESVDAAIATCQFESSNSDCSLVQRLKDKQTQKRAVDNKIRSYDNHRADTVTNFFLLLVALEKEGVEMSRYDRSYPFMRSDYSAFKDSADRHFFMAKLEKVLDEMSESGVTAIGEELSALKARATVLCDLRRQSAELDKEITTIKAQLGIE